METINIYICCALTKGSLGLKHKVSCLRQAIKDFRPRWKALEFFGLGPSPSDGAVLQYDLEKVRESDLVFVITDEDSWGGGIEIGFSLMIGKPVLFHISDSWVKTRMITGMCELYPEQFIRDTYYTHSPDNLTYEGQAIAALDRASKYFGLARPRAEREGLSALWVLKRQNPAFQHEAFLPGTAVPV